MTNFEVLYNVAAATFKEQCAWVLCGLLIMTTYKTNLRRNSNTTLMESSNVLSKHQTIKLARYKTHSVHKVHILIEMITPSLFAFESFQFQTCL